MKLVLLILLCLPTISQARPNPETKRLLRRVLGLPTPAPTPVCPNICPAVRGNKK